MADFFKIQIKKGSEVFNSLLINLDNVTGIEQIGNKIYFSMFGVSTQIIGEYQTPEEAQEVFNKLNDDY